MDTTKSTEKIENPKKKKSKTSLYKSELRMPPQNIEAEISVLGSIMIDKDAIIKVADILKPNDFYKEANEKIFEAILDLYQDQQPLDILSVSSRLKEKGNLEAVGGHSYLVELINAVPTSSSVASYARLVQKKSTLRRLISAASEIVEMGYEEELPVDGILDKAEQKLFSVSQKFPAPGFRCSFRRGLPSTASSQ